MWTHSHIHTNILTDIPGFAVLANSSRKTLGLLQQYRHNNVKAVNDLWFNLHQQQTEPY